MAQKNGTHQRGHFPSNDFADSHCQRFERVAAALKASIDNKYQVFCSSYITLSFYSLIIISNHFTFNWHNVRALQKGALSFFSKEYVIMEIDWPPKVGAQQESYQRLIHHQSSLFHFLKCNSKAHLSTLPTIDSLAGNQDDLTTR